MRIRFPILFFLALLAVVVSLWPGGVSSSLDTIAQTTYPDEEIAYINFEGRVAISDPLSSGYHAALHLAVE